MTPAPGSAAEAESGPCTGKITIALTSDPTALDPEHRSGARFEESKGKSLFQQPLPAIDACKCGAKIVALQDAVACPSFVASGFHRDDLPMNWETQVPACFQPSTVPLPHSHCRSSTDSAISVPLVRPIGRSPGQYEAPLRPGIHFPGPTVRILALATQPTHIASPSTQRISGTMASSSSNCLSCRARCEDLAAICKQQIRTPELEAK